MKRYYCTYFDRNYLFKALALIESLGRHERTDYVLYAVCMDEITRTVLKQLALPHVVTVGLHEVEYLDAELHRVKKERSLVEYYWTLTPSIIRYLIRRYQEIDALTYLDADLFFFASPDPIFDELEQGSVLIHEHRYAPRFASLEAGNGKYNVGLLSFRRDTTGMAVLERWREQCIEWCYWKSEDGKMGDQLYLNDWPERYSGIVVLQHRGCAIAPWNHECAPLSVDPASGTLMAGDAPLVFYHFQSLGHAAPQIVLPAKHLTYPLPLKNLEYAYQPYIERMLEWCTRVQSILPEFTFGLKEDNIYSEGHTIFIRRKDAAALSDVSKWNVKDFGSSEWICLATAQVLDDADALVPQASPIVPRPSVSGSEDELLLALNGIDLVADIRSLCIVGAHKYQERELLDFLFPNLTQILLFEPVPELYESLRQFEHADPRVRVFPYAISGSDGTAVFHLTDNDAASSSLLEFKKHKEAFPYVHMTGAITVETRRLDSVLGEHGLAAPDMLMLDVQGAEYAIISSLSESVRAAAKIIYTEASTTEFYAGARVLSELQEELNTTHEFVAFSPLTSSVREHGNALFVRRGVRAGLANGKDFLRSVLESVEELCTAGRYAEAMRMAELGLQYDRKNLSLLNDIVVIATLQKNYMHALETLKRLFLIDPENPTARENLKVIEEAMQERLPASAAAPGRRPKVSAIVSTYKAERFIKACLDDLLAQTLYKKGDLEIVVVDSASPENEKKIVERYAKRHANIRYIRTVKRETVYQAWNRGIKAASGLYITNANTDDRHAPDALETLAQALERHPEAAVVYGDSYITTNPEETWKTCTPERKFAWPAFDKRLLFDVCYLGPHPMWRRSLHEAYGLFDESYRSAGDYAFWLKLAAHNEQMLHIGSVVGIYLENQASVSLSDGALNWNESERARESFWPAVWGARPKTNWRSFEVPAAQAPAAQAPVAQVPVAQVSEAKSVLLLCDYFWPSVGGVEVYVEDLGRRLQHLGYRVDVACRALPERSAREHAGMHIHEIEMGQATPQQKKREAIDALRRRIVTAGYQSVIALSQPDNWIADVLKALPEPRPQLILMPSINAENLVEWAHNGHAPEVIALLKSVDRIVTVTESGYDAAFVSRADIPFVFIPHAMEQDAADLDFRNEYGFPKDVPLFVMVANFWPVKHHDGLIRQLSRHTGSWRLAIIGNRIDTESAYYDHVAALARSDQRIRIIGGLPRPVASAAIRDADVLLVPSKAESAGPLVVLQAMSYGTPWIAAPSCNAVKDEAGGIIAPLEEFPKAVDFLMADQERARSVGEAGRKHWEASFRWQSSLPFFRALMEGAVPERTLVMPEALRKEAARMQQDFASFCGAATSVQGCTISVIIPTYNRLGILKKCLDALTRQTISASSFEVFICDDGSTDGTEAAVKKMRMPYRLEYLRQENKGPAAARNLGIRKAAGELLLILNDDAILEPDALAIHLALHAKHRGEKIAVLGEFKWPDAYTHVLAGYIASKTDTVFDYPKMTAGLLYDFNHFYTCNISLPTRTAIEAGLFDERFSGPASEDIEFGFRLEQAGYHVLYEPECIAWHEHAVSVDSFCRMHQTRGYGAVTLASLQPGAFSLEFVTRRVLHQWKKEAESARVQMEQLKAALEKLERDTISAQVASVAAEVEEHLRLLQRYYVRLGMLANPLLEKLAAEHSGAPSRAYAPLISVVIPCYNYADYLPEAVESVVNQTYRNWEIIIVNDGSTDHSKDVAETLIRKYPQHAIRLIDQPNSGQPAVTRNNGISAARGTYILPLDADDVLMPTMLEAGLERMRESGCDIVYTDQEYFQGEEKIVRTLEFDRARLFAQNYFAYCSLYKRAMWKAVGGYKQNVRGYEDWEFWITCAEAGYTFCRLPEVLLRYRVKKESMITSALKRDEELKAQIVLYHPALYPKASVEAARRLIGGGWNAGNEDRTGARTGSVTVTAIVSAYNEGDVIAHVIGDLISNGVQVYLLDNNSTDNTVEEASRWLGNGLIHIEKFPDDCGYPARNKKEYVWRDILRRKEELAQELPADWFIHADADEFRESPFPGTTLAEGIARIDQEGYTAINFELLNFRPVDNRFVPGTDVREALTHYETGEWFDNGQIKAWKNTGHRIDLASSGGHAVGFIGRKIAPVPFILRHYPIRSQAHGEQKVYRERLARFASEERAAGWHVQYDDVAKAHGSFLYDETKLVRYDGEAFRAELFERAAKKIAVYRSPDGTEAQHLEQALIAMPNDVKSLRRLSSLYLAHDAVEPAQALLRRILNVLPNDAEAAHLIAQLEGSKTERQSLRQARAAQMPSPFVSIVIPVFNNVELTRACIEAIFRTTEAGLFELIIVDNASTDGTKAYLQSLRQTRPCVTVIENEANLGFSKANNQGARLASGRYVLFLNNDTEPQEGWLESMLAVYEEVPEAGIVGAKLLYPNGTIQHAGIEFLRLETPVELGAFGMIDAVPDHPFRNAPSSLPEANIRRSLDMVTGACLLIEARLFAELGGFDDAYKNGCEDIDLCLKARRLGRAVVYEPKAVVTHHEGQSEGRFAHVRGNLERFFIVWGGCFDASHRFCQSAAQRRATVVWEGSQFVYHSLALINREMCTRLASEPGIELSLIPFEADRFTPAPTDPASALKAYINKDVGPADLHIRLQWPPNLTPPEHGRWVINQPWEFGALPLEWVRVFSKDVDEMWVISSYVRDTYIASGIDPERVAVIPCGIDPKKFHRKVKPFRLKTKKKFRFLFVGGTIYRKGIDILLDAYTQSFTSKDDVCLVIKDMGGDSFYKGMNAKERIEDLRKKQGAPAIEYIDRMLSPEEIAGLYTACDVLVHPYRGEGFGLPILEAMACGTPAIVPNGGACLDFCTPDNSLLVEAPKIFYQNRRVGEFETAIEPWLLEPSIEDVKSKMRFAFGHPAEMRQLGAKASLDAHARWTWDHAYGAMQERISALMTRPIRRFDTSREEGGILTLVDRITERIACGEAQAALGLLAEATTLIENTMTSLEKESILAELAKLRAMIERTLDEAVPADGRLEEAERLLSEQKTAEAVNILAELAEEDPSNIDVLNDLGAAAIMMGNYPAAIDFLSKVTAIDPGNATALENLAFLQQELEHSVDEDTIRQAEALIDAGNTAEARMMLNRLLDRNAGHIHALNDLSVIEIMEKNWTEAAQLINRVITIDPMNEIARQNLEYLDQTVSELGGR
ncbi:MAG: FkbM family methyltransferase [Acidobacteriota bacterium]